MHFWDIGLVVSLALLGASSLALFHREILQ